MSELGMISEVAYGEQIELKHFPDKDGMRTAKTLYLRPLVTA